MKKICVVLAVALSMTAVDASAQNLLKRIGKAVEKEVTKVVKQDKEADAKAEPVKEKPAQPQAQPAQPAQQQVQPAQQQAQPAQQQAPAVPANGKKTYIGKDVKVYYKTGREAYAACRVYFDGTDYYVKQGRDEYKLTPCNVEHEGNKYYFTFIENIYGADVYVKDDLPLAVKEQPAQQNAAESAPAVQANGEKKYVKNIDLYFKTGRVSDAGCKLYYDGSNYYIEKKDKMFQLTPCDGEFMERKYYFFMVEYGVELYVNENLPGAVGKRVVKNDHDIKPRNM